jgi:hypothetical protein
MNRLAVILFWIVGSVYALASNPSTYPPAENAALRYWMAFAQMNDMAISPEDSIRMDEIVSGNAPWQEQRFGALVERNKDAIETMIRGTALPYCEWGVEYDLGPAAPAAHLPKARALARLNRLYAVRLESTGNYDAAVRATIAGIRFAQHMAQNASFLGVLTAKTALEADLVSVQQMTASHGLSTGQTSGLRNAIKELPEGAFDWSNAARLESGGLHAAMSQMSRSSDARALYQSWFGSAAPADFRVPGASEIAQLDRVMGSYAQLLRMQPEAAVAQLPRLQKQIATLDPVSQVGIPNPQRLVSARAELIRELRKAQAALKAE